MSIVTALLSTDVRPRDEARRVVAALGNGIDPHAETSAAERSAAPLAAAGAVIQQIADEKAPRLEPPAGHAGEFTDQGPPTSAFEDHEPAQHLSLRADARFSIHQGVDEDPASWASTPPPASQESAPDSDAPAGEAETVHEREHPAAIAPVEPPDEGSTVAAAAFEAGGGAPPVEDAADLREALDLGDAVEDEDPDDVEDDIEDEDPDEDPDDAEDEDPAPASQFAPPSPTDAYAAAGSRWGDAPEIVALPDLDSDEDEPTAEDVDGPAPSRIATDPPMDLAEPEPEAEPSPMQRLRAWLDRTLADKHKKIRLIAVGAAVIVTVVVLAVVSLSGGRGKPPEPLGTTVLPPAQVDNPEPARTDGPLIPSTVSASCGNDSDPVAPFSSEKTRAWLCKRVNGLDLNVLNITFDKPMVITSITIVPGFNYVAPDGRDEWARHRLVTGVTWRMGGAVYPQEITPTRTGVTKQFPSVITQEMSMTVTGSTRPPLGGGGLKGGGIAGAGDADDPSKIDEHTAVSSITITGYPVDPGA